ncbi:MAG: efflux RND transporter periplasmic adaptor subunit [Leptolinea sp.]|nr:efflux RND transporter periplasmic adaptor subunit [Leptolinea sp.]
MKSKRLKVGVYIVLLLLLLVAGGIFFVNKYRQSSRSPLPEGVTTTPVTRGTLTTRVGSTGKVRPNQLVTLNWMTGGIIGNIHVKNNDTVKAGDVLVELDQTSLESSILQAIEELPAAQRALNDLNISDQKRTQAKEDLAKAEIEVDKARDKRELMNQRNASDTNLMAAEASYLQAKSNLKKMEEVFAFVQDQPEDDVNRAQITAQLSLARKNYDWALWNFQYAQNKPLPEDIKIADTELKVAESKLADARRNWDRVKNKPDPDDLAAAQSNVDALQAQINLTRITAPIAATVIDSRLLEGDVVKSGDKALTLIDSSHMFLDISVSEVDINKIKPGKAVTFSFDAIPGKSFEGVVSEIGKINQDDQDNIYYTVTCEITDPDASIKPGMTAASSIEVEKVENVILIPNSALQAKKKEYSVYVFRENKVQQIPVELGLISDMYSELKSGDLHEGDALVTNPQVMASQGAGK